MGAFSQLTTDELIKIAGPPASNGFSQMSDEELMKIAGPPAFTGEASPERMSAHRLEPLAASPYRAMAEKVGRVASKGLFGREAMEQYVTPEGFNRERFMQTPVLAFGELAQPGTVSKGVLEGIGGFTSPEGALMLGATAGIGAAASSPALKALVSAGFSADMLGGLYQQSKEFRQAVDAGDPESANEIAGQMLVTGGMAGLTGVHAAKSGAQVTRGFMKQPPRVNVEAEPIRPQPVVEPARTEIPPLPEGFVLEKSPPWTTRPIKEIPTEELIRIVEQKPGVPKEAAPTPAKPAEQLALPAVPTAVTEIQAKPANRTGPRISQVGEPDLLDAAVKVGKMRPKTKDSDPANYDGWDEVMTKGEARLLVSKLGMAPDDYRQRLSEAGHHFDTTSDMYTAIGRAQEARSAMRGQLATEQADKAFSNAAYENVGKSVTQKSATPINTSSLTVGSTFKMKGEAFEVTAIGEDGTVTVKDGRRFGTQELADATDIYPDRNSVKLTEADTSFDPPEKPELRVGDIVQWKTKMGTTEEVNYRGTVGDKAVVVTKRGSQVSVPVADLVPLEQKPAKAVSIDAPKEWAAFLKLRESGTSTSELIKFAKGMQDVENQSVAMRFLAPTKEDIRIGEERFKAIEETPQSEIDKHFSMAGIGPAKPISIADFSKELAKAGEQQRGQAASEIVGQLGEKALGGQKKAGSLEGSPMFPAEEKQAGMFKGGPEAGSLPIFIEPEQMPLPKYAGSINLERVGADYPVRKLIRDTYDQYKGTIDERRRGVITHEETQKLAEELGMTERRLLKRKLGKAFNAEEVTAARSILNASAQRLNLLREQWAKSGSDEAVAEFRKAMDLHAEIQAEVSGISSEAGRALSAHRIISEPAKGYKKMLDVLGGRELNEEILKQFSQIDASDPRQVNAFVQAYSKVTIWDQVYEAWRSMGLLSGPVTHLVNTASNLLTISTRIPETLIGAATERVMSKIQKRPQGAFAGEVKEEVLGALAGIKPGLKTALAAWNEEMPLSEARFEAHRRYIPGKLGKNIRIPYRMLSAADEMLKSVNYGAEAYQLAYRKARVAGVKGKEALARETLAHLQDRDIVESANKAAAYWTFNQPLGKWSQKVSQLRDDIPGARYLIPFLRTSTNIAKFGLERTPLNFARLLRDYHKGGLKGVELSEELAKPFLGTMIGAGVVTLAAEGYITGSGPKNQNERETMLRPGWRPYSFKIGDTYYPYGRLEPIGSVVGMAADFAEAKGLEKTSQIPGKIAFSISRNLTSKTFMQGLSDLNNAVSDPDRWGQKFIKSYAGTLIPNIVATTARVIDPYQRITESPLQAIQARIPGLSQKLPLKRDLLGRAIKKQGLIPIGKQSSEFIDQELVRVKAWIGDLDKKNMTAQQFDEYAQRVGKALRPRLEIILKSSMPDDIKAKAAKRAASDARSQIRRLMRIPAR